LPFLEPRDLVERLAKRAAVTRERHARLALVAQEELGDLGSGRRQGRIEDVRDRPGTDFVVRGVRQVLAPDTRAARP
jgi:hypothetical protein